MKIFIDSGNLKEIEALVPLGIIDGITTNPSLLAKEPGDYKEILKRICQIVKGPTSAEVVATDAEGHDSRGPRPRRDRRAHRRQGAVHARRRQGVQGAVVRRHARQRHADLLADAGAAGRQGRAPPTSARSSAASTTSRRPAWADRARSSRSSTTTSSPPKSSSRRPAARCTSSKRRAWAPTSAPARRR